ncbi:MAG: SEC-C metal-binding domain-containing protein [Bacteroidia bacterium]|nr:SEC-C metal-binding domain-containing protein [Bacteroidia bacterium]
MGKVISFKPDPTISLSALLSEMLDKQGLLLVCEDFGVDHKPSMPKKELSTRIEKAFLERPEILGDRLPLEDIRFLYEIVEAGGYLESETPYVSLSLVSVGIVYYSVNEEKKQFTFTIPANFLEVLKPIIKDMVESEVLFEVERIETLIVGLVQMYGVISVSDLYRLLTQRYDVIMDEQELSVFLAERYRLILELELFPLQKGMGVASNLVEEPEAFYRSVQKRKDLDYFFFDEEELFLFGEGDFFPMFDEADDLEDYLNELDPNNPLKNMEHVLMAWEFTQMEAPLKEILSIFSKRYPMKGLETVNKMMKLLVDFQNNLPRWSLKGNSPSQLFSVERKQLQPLPELPFEMPPSGNPFDVFGPKVGRNDPCPCGSGKKFKKCCGAD